MQLEPDQQHRKQHLATSQCSTAAGTAAAGAPGAAEPCTQLEAAREPSAKTSSKQLQPSLPHQVVLVSLTATAAAAVTCQLADSKGGKAAITSADDLQPAVGMKCMSSLGGGVGSTYPRRPPGLSPSGSPQQTTVGAGGGDGLLSGPGQVGALQPGAATTTAAKASPAASGAGAGSGTDCSAGQGPVQCPPAAAAVTAAAGSPPLSTPRSRARSSTDGSSCSIASSSASSSSCTTPGGPHTSSNNSSRMSTPRGTYQPHHKPRSGGEAEPTKRVGTAAPPPPRPWPPRGGNHMGTVSMAPAPPPPPPPPPPAGMAASSAGVGTSRPMCAGRPLPAAAAAAAGGAWAPMQQAQKLPQQCYPGCMVGQQPLTPRQWGQPNASGCPVAPPPPMRPAAPGRGPWGHPHTGMSLLVPPGGLGYPQQPPPPPPRAPPPPPARGQWQILATATNSSSGSSYYRALQGGSVWHGGGSGTGNLTPRVTGRVPLPPPRPAAAALVPVGTPRLMARVSAAVPIIDPRLGREVQAAPAAVAAVAGQPSQPSATSQNQQRQQQEMLAGSMATQLPRWKQPAGDNSSSCCHGQDVVPGLDKGPTTAASAVGAKSSPTTPIKANDSDNSKASCNSCALEARQVSPWCGAGDVPSDAPHLSAARSSYDDLISRLPDDLLL